MFLTHKHYLGIRISIYLILITLFVMAVSIILLESRRFRMEAHAKNEIDNLYTEIGALNQEKMELYQEFLETQTHLKTLYSTLAEMSQSIDNTNQETAVLEKALDSAQIKLSEQNQHITNLINGVAEQSNYNDLSQVDGILDILIIGTHGSLSDTLMVARVLPDKGKILFVSVPRDLYYGGRKINEIYYYYGVEKLEEAIMNVTGIVVEKYAVFNLQSFLTIFDLLFPDGVEVDVAKSIYDNAYPTATGGYSIFSLKAGKQTFDANTALKYVRTRHADSDFSRAKRQQNFIKSAVTTLKSQDLLTHIDQSFELLENLNKILKTNIGIFESLQYLKDYSSYSLDTGYVLDTGVKEFIKSDEETVNSRIFTSTTNVNGQYIIIPVKGEFSDVWEYVKWLSEK